MIFRFALLSFAMCCASICSAASMSEVQKATIMAHLELCVQASVAQSSAPFSDWTRETTRVPNVYLSYEKFASRDSSFVAVLGQRKDHPGKPFICRIIRDGVEGSFLDVSQDDRGIVRFVQSLPKGKFGNVRFRKRSALQVKANREALSGCINGQIMMLNADITNKGAASFGVNIPLLENRSC